MSKKEGPANHSNLKSFQKALFGWKKCPPKIHFVFELANRLIMADIQNQPMKRRIGNFKPLDLNTCKLGN